MEYVPSVCGECSHALISAPGASATTAVSARPSAVLQSMEVFHIRIQSIADMVHWPTVAVGIISTEEGVIIAGKFDLRFIWFTILAVSRDQVAI